jgi:hypothetical protein
MRDQKRSGMNKKVAKEMSNLSHFSKTDIGVGQGADFCQPYTVDGQRWLTKGWCARIQFLGRRQSFLVLA